MPSKSREDVGVEVMNKRRGFSLEIASVSASDGERSARWPSPPWNAIAAALSFAALACAIAAEAIWMNDDAM